MFRSLNWYGELARLTQAHWQIYSLLQSPGALDAYIKSQQVVSVNENRVVTYADGSTRQMSAESRIDEYAMLHSISAEPDGILTDLDRAEELYNRQLVVVVSTYIEVILDDFLTALFRTFPERMYAFLHVGEGHRGVSLREITRVASLSELLNNLSRQAASNFLRGRFQATLNSLAQISNVDMPDDLRNRLIDTVEQRNRIVHEASREEVTTDDVAAAVDAGIELIKFLAKAALRNGIPVDFSPGDTSVLGSVLEDGEEST